MGEVISNSINHSRYSLLFKKYLGCCRQVWNDFTGERLVACAILAPILFKLLYWIASSSGKFGDAFYHILSPEIRSFAIALPLVLLIRQQTIRVVLLTLFCLFLFWTCSWISYLCVLITVVTINWVRVKKSLPVVIVLFISAVYVLPHYQPKMYTAYEQGLVRVDHYKVATDNWNNIWFGEGLGYFASLPENQPKFEDGVVVKKWLHVVHSDMLQGFLELGVLMMIPILTVFLWPMMWLKPDPWSASYLCVLLNGLIDFPFHRQNTAILCLIIIGFMYLRRFSR